MHIKLDEMSNIFYVEKKTFAFLQKRIRNALEYKQRERRHQRQRSCSRTMQFFWRTNNGSKEDCRSFQRQVFFTWRLQWTEEIA